MNKLNKNNTGTGNLLEELQIAIPTKIANLKLPEPDLLNYYKLKENRIFWIDFDIDESIDEVCKDILQINMEDINIPVEERKPIKLFIYSRGGDGQACFMLLDVIKLSKTPVYTINAGISMSAGALILLAGHKRFCLKNSICLIHSGSGGATGTYEQTASQMKDYEHFVNRMREYIMERSTIDQKTFNKHKSHEWYIYADEQLKFGIVHEIVEDLDQIL